MPRRGYFGGTFDPPHVGHQILAAEGMYQLELDQLFWILTPLPPHKLERKITDVKLREEMVQTMTHPISGWNLSRVDLDREPPYYAADSMEIVRRQNPDDHISYLIGEDSLRDLPTWYDVSRFLLNIDCLAVLERPGIETEVDKLAEILPGIKNKLRFLTAPEIQISSSEIRKRIKTGIPFRHFLTPEVYHFLVKNDIYSS